MTKVARRCRNVYWITVRKYERALNVKKNHFMEFSAVYRWYSFINLLQMIQCARNKKLEVINYETFKLYLCANIVNLARAI